MSVVTAYLSDAKVVVRDNTTYKGSLAALYDATWAAQQPGNVFVSRSVKRDEPEDRANVQVREQITALEWSVNGETPSMLRTSFQCRGILVRDEYRFILNRIWDKFSQFGGAASGYVPNADIGRTELNPPYNPFMGLQVVPSGEKEVPGVIVTGTPGIGKSLFLLYVLTQRLLAQQTTVFQFKRHEFIIFHETGVYSSEQTKTELLFLPHHTWFLVDSNTDNYVPLLTFLEACSTYSRKLVMAASPRQGRFSFLSKHRQIETLWMDPFTLEEYITARHLQYPTTPPPERLLELFFKQYGLSARDAFENASMPDRHHKTIEDNLLAVSWEGIERTVINLSRGFFDTTFSHHVLIARRQRGNPSDFYVEFATKFIADMVVKTFMDMELERGPQLYRHFLRSPKARAAAGGLLEACALNILPHGGQWLMYPMKKSNKRQPGQSNQHWSKDPSTSPCTLLIGHEGLAVRILKGRPVDRPRQEFMQVARVDYGPSLTPPQNEKGFYVPVADNEASFDAWIYEPSTKHMVILQATVKMKDHDIKTKGLDWLGKLSEDPLDLVVLTDERGGTDISTPFENVPRMRNVYRLVY